MKCPEYIKVKDHNYKINTSYKNAIKCQEIAESNINDTERTLAIIYTLFGDDGLNNEEDYAELLEKAQKYLSCGKELPKKDYKPDMDYIQDMEYIEASFMSDYGIDLTKEDMNWWKFNKLINGLSNSELGNCCILNKIRNARRYDASKIKDPKERQEFIEWQKSIALEKHKPQKEYTSEEKNNMEEFYKQMSL